MKHIFLIGYMGCGKSFWGRQLANSLNLNFVDLDDLIEKTEGMSIPEMFKKFGEASFRQKEQKALLSIGDFKNATIVSTGGGAPCFHDNMSAMNAMGKTLFLEAEADILKQNILKSNTERPIVKSIPESELEAYISNHLDERLPFYQLAQTRVNVDGLKLKNLIGLFK